MTVDTIGVIGLGPMGKRLSQNMQNSGVDVIGHDISEAKRQEAENVGVPTAATLEELIDSFDGTKAFWIMVPSHVVDTVLDHLHDHLDDGDIIIEGGNSQFQKTERRSKEANEHGIRFIGTGVSGGEEGALKGPCLMPGGDEDAYEAVEDILVDVAAEAYGEPCVTYIGDNGAGHFVKTVHNGIEYAMMQGIAETYHLLQAAGYSYNDIQACFQEWQDTEELGGFLTEITADILDHEDPKTGKPFLEIVKDSASQKGTGRWTAQVALDNGVNVMNISGAVFARLLSADKEHRGVAAQQLGERDHDVPAPDNLEQHARDALYATFLAAYDQGFALMASAADEQGYDLDLPDIAKIWRGGCIIRSDLLNPIMDALRTSDQPHLLLTDRFASELQGASDGLREAHKHAVDIGVPTPAYSDTINYMDGLRHERLPSASMIQGQRDYFGSHTYQRVDKDGVFHTLWSEDQSEVQQE